MVVVALQWACAREEVRWLAAWGLEVARVATLVLCGYSGVTVLWRWHENDATTTRWQAVGCSKDLDVSLTSRQPWCFST
jgi:hypothetical protein